MQPGSRDGWRDMAAFAERHHDAALRDRLLRAIEGKGAFHRFRDLIHQESLVQQWFTFSTDRQLGRAREFLASQGIRAGWRIGRTRADRRNTIFVVPR